MPVTSANPQNDSSASERRFATVQLSVLRVGAMLRYPIYDGRSDRDVLLLAARTKLTARILERLQRRGVLQVRVSQDDLDGMKFAPRPPALAASAQICATQPQSPDAGRTHLRRLLTPESYLHKVNRHGSSKYDGATARKFVKGYRESVQQVETLFAGLSAGGLRDASEIATLSSTSLVKIAEDLDLFVRMGLTPATDKYPCKHSLQTAMLAMSIATVMGYKLSELVELGIGCLVHDAGMLHINPELLNAGKELTSVQFLEITKHPAITFELLKDLPDVPIGARLVAYQMHERCDGSGYPRKRHANQIHPLSKIAAVADVFVALISPRPHRPGMLPYHAMEELIHGARRRLYDSASVRALLHTVSLFPIGSCVQVNDGRVGRVVRSNREAFSRPVVELWQPDVVHAAVELVDLNNAGSLFVMRAIPELPTPSDDAKAEVQFQAECWE